MLTSLRRAVARSFRFVATVTDAVAVAVAPARPAPPEVEPAYVPGNPPVTLSARAQEMRAEGVRKKPERDEVPPPPPLPGSAKARARNARIAAGGEE